MKLHRLAAVGSMLAATAVSLPASAEEAPTVAVSLVDLDLTRSNDMRVAQRRLASAIEQVCGAGRIVSLPEPASIKRCRDEARANVATQLAARTQPRSLARN